MKPTTQNTMSKRTTHEYDGQSGYWVIQGPRQGKPWIFTAGYRRSFVIRNFIRDYNPTDTWKQLYRKGYRCVRIVSITTESK